jgi:hypothetical protein
MNYDEWVTSVPEEIKGDSLWKVEAYRLALFVADIVGRFAAEHSTTLITFYVSRITLGHNYEL